MTPHSRRSVSGMVSSSDGSSSWMQNSVKSFSKSIPAALMSASSFSKMAISAPEERSAVFMRLW